MNISLLANHCNGHDRNGAKISKQTERLGHGGFLQLLD